MFHHHGWQMCHQGGSIVHRGQAQTDVARHRRFLAFVNGKGSFRGSGCNGKPLTSRKKSWENGWFYQSSKKGTWFMEFMAKDSSMKLQTHYKSKVLSWSINTSDLLAPCEGFTDFTAWYCKGYQKTWWIIFTSNKKAENTYSFIFLQIPWNPSEPSQPKNSALCALHFILLPPSPARPKWTWTTTTLLPCPKK